MEDMKAEKKMKKRYGKGAPPDPRIFGGTLAQGPQGRRRTAAAAAADSKGSSQVSL